MMYICNCAGVTQQQFDHQLHQGATSLKALRAALGIGKGCGKCAREMGEVLKGRQQGMQPETACWLISAVYRACNESI